MSRRLISRSTEHREVQGSLDLQQLQADGYEVEVRSGNLLIGHVPFRNAEGAVAYGTLVCPLDLSGNLTAQPKDHVVRLAGGVPYDADGAKWTGIIANEQPLAVAGLTTSATLSQKPAEGDHRYRDYHHKMTTYIAILTGPARQIDSDATAQTHPIFVDEDGELLFNYIDTASSRAGITEATAKLATESVAIVGLGGTGSYILDYIAKAPIEHIHLFDGDEFLQHNAFRSPGAPSIDDLQEEELSKVAWFGRVYSRMRKNIHEHDYYIDESNVEELREMDFVFIAADSGKAKRLLAARLEEWGIPFIDVGMGLYEYETSVGGQLRVTTSTPDFHEHVAVNRRISFAAEDDEQDGDNVYDLNIQITELNALNAALAVVKWKKLCGFYVDDTFEHHAIYVVNGNAMVNEDKAEAP